MSTFLELCQELHKDTGVGGALSSVLNQSGMLRRIVGWIADADVAIQKEWIDWNFLWAEWTITLVEDIDEYSPPDLLGTFNKESFWIDSGTDDASQVQYVEYRDYAKSYKHFSIDDDEPYVVTVLPNKMVKVVPAPSSAAAGKIISVEYWKKPAKMTANGDVSAIPAQFHETIIWLAKTYHAAYLHDNGAYQDAYLRYQDWLEDLQSHSLPGRENDNLSAAVNPIVIEVE